MTCNFISNFSPEELNTQFVIAYPMGEDSANINLVRTAFLQLFFKLIEISKRKISNVYVVFQRE